VVDAPVEYDSGPDARAERGIKHVAKTYASAPDCFSESRGIRVIVNFRANVEGTLHLRGQGKIAPAGQIRRIQHYSANWIERSWRADTASRHPRPRGRMLLEHGVDCAFHRRESRRRIFPRRHGRACLEQDCASCVDEAGSNFRAADSYSEREVSPLIFGCLLLWAHCYLSEDSQKWLSHGRIVHR